ncbi:protein FAM92A-like [Pollicipes pollicipes]|uniref:protein FAM92A-like n=1 Tax=Pollicipes pollicipes TaxID=41117 RepID=UPI00188506D7|nr:protein FAM92A-like [Pollicipes pollicipes]
MQAQGFNPAANIHSVSETQANFINSRIQKVERHFGLLCRGVAVIARKNAKCRDSMDDLARVIVGYADTETLNRTMRTQVTHLADTLCGIADIQQILVEKLELRIVGGLSTYKDACKHAKGDLASTFKAQTREMRTSNKLEAMRARAPGDYRQIAMAETELQRAAIDVARTHAALEESMEYFEMKKLRDLRRFLLEFCHAKIQYHARNIEMYSRAYSLIQEIDIEGDLEDFRKAMKFPASTLPRHPTEVIQSAAAMSSTGSSRPDLAALSSSRLAGFDRPTPRFAAGNENSPYNRGERRRSQSMDREHGARLRVQSRPRITDDDVFQHSYANLAYSAARASRSRSS